MFLSLSKHVGECVVHFGLDALLKLTQRPFAVIKIPCLGHLINSCQAFLEGIAGVKVERLVFG